LLSHGERVAFPSSRIATNYEKRGKISENDTIFETSEEHEYRKVIEYLKSWKRSFSKIIFYHKIALLIFSLLTIS
jgi:hypothetical protein